MPASTGEEPPSSPIQPLVPSMDANLLVATGKPHPGVIDPLLLALACSGSSEKLQSLLHGEGSQASGNTTNGSQEIQPASDDVEAFLKESLLEGVTVGGDTALHAVATYGDDPNFVASANFIYIKAKHLLFAQNKKGDTPLHCAARAGRFQMVSSLIHLVKGEEDGVNKVKELLKTENKLKETALHEAIRSGNNDIVKLLIEEDQELARFPEDGISPLYLAISLGNKIIAQILYEKSKSGQFLSYSGPNGQNALHAAVLRGKELTEMLLEWKADINRLTTETDKNGSTPLHFAASLLSQASRGSVCRQVVEANTGALYAQDKEGLFPIHVAASVGAMTVISIFLKKSPSCAGLRDDKGRTFLQVAVQKRQVWTVFSACINRSISWILNMQDNDGNTALHLAVQAGSLMMFCALLQNRQVHLNLINGKGQTPLDISLNKINPIETYNQTSVRKILNTLQLAGATRGISRRDHFKENYNRQVKRDEKEEMEKLQGSTQTLTIGSVLIASVTFGATFALPGGYRADDHTNGGAPTLAGRYAFHAFIMSNTFAFIFSLMATIALMRSGSPMFDLRSRHVHLNIAFYFVLISITSLTTALATAAYIVLAPVAHKTAIAICVLSTLVVLFRLMELTMKFVLSRSSLFTRKGFIWTVVQFVYFILGNVAVEFWPTIFCFGWAAYARK